MSNYVFKQFCSELDEGSLTHLLDILAQPLGKDGLLEMDSDEESDSEEDELVEVADAGDSDDDE